MNFHQAEGHNDRSVLVISSNRWPLSARLAITLIQHGCDVSAICPPGHPLEYVRAVRRIFRYRTIGSRGSLVRALQRTCPLLVVPCDDPSVAQLHEVHSHTPSLRPLIERSLGDPAGFPVLESRERLLATARALGVHVPEGSTVTSPAEAGEHFARFGTVALLKLDGTSGGKGVRIVRSPAEAAVQFQSLRRAASLAASLKRLVVDREPLALWEWRVHEQAAISLQQFISGTPANIMVACWQGEVLAAATVCAVSWQGTTGAANVVRLIDHPGCRQAAALLARRLNMSGFFGLDFILETGTDIPWLLELNPRCTQLGHLPLAQGDLAGALCARVYGGVRSPPTAAIRGDTIAFFPQALRWGADRHYLNSIHHDVPWQERRLVEHLLAEHWPDRQWPARLYGAIRRGATAGPESRQAIAFDALGPGEAPGVGPRPGGTH
jgi:hypothetical protein